MSNRMQKNTNPEHIASAVCMRLRQYKGTFLFVEGTKDMGVYERFINKEKCWVQAPFQKDNKSNTRLK